MTYYAPFVTALLVSTFSIDSTAQTFTTITSGAWSDVTSVWSTNGGVTACSCSPGSSPGAITINVGHAITVTPNLTFTGSNLSVLATGSLAGSFDISAVNSNIDFFGPVSLNRFTQSGTSNTTIHSGGSLFASNRIILNGGAFTVDGALLNSGRMDIASGVTLNLLNGAKWNILTGNLTNDGTINLDPGSCIETNGNIQNTATGVINGAGALNSGGNIVNSGTIATTIAWCSNGAGVGMPTAEDCATSTGICNGIVLPVELESFEVEMKSSDQVAITWATLSEYNCSHFVVSKSADGIYWTEITTVLGAGTSTQRQLYYVIDEANTGVTYYKLTQYDLDGRKNQFDPVSLSNNSSGLKWILYPNPVNGKNKITVKNLATEEGSLTMQNMQGNTLDDIDFNTGTGEYSYQLNNLTRGVYFITINQGGNTKTERLVVTD